jgi:hypothetical protein
MRSVKAGAFFGAIWLLGGCMVPDESPVAGFKQLAELTGREFVALCEWSRDYMGGYMPNNEETDEGSRESRHRCPPTQGDLWERSDTIKFAYWKSDECGEFVTALGGEPCRLTVDEFETIVRALADDPCNGHAFDFTNCSLSFPPLSDE